MKRAQEIGIKEKKTWKYKKNGLKIWIYKKKYLILHSKHL